MLLAELDVGGPLHVAGPHGMSRFDFARQVCAAYGLPDRALRAGSLADLADADRRPGCVVLDCSMAAALVPLPGPVPERLTAT